ncbi:hypothetical protein AcV7_005590 [Taiwanofungus camphoratus]|nr:hypothetical protein AcV7_005590 [Antrodia cinnamomea]
MNARVSRSRAQRISRSKPVEPNIRAAGGSNVARAPRRSSKSRASGGVGKRLTEERCDYPDLVRRELTLAEACCNQSMLITMLTEVRGAHRNVLLGATSMAVLIAFSVSGNSIQRRLSEYIDPTRCQTEEVRAGGGHRISGLGFRTKLRSLAARLLRRPRCTP